jgi:hypothetical protein
VEVELVDGEVKRVTVSSEEPEWSVNFKKALISAFKMKLPEQEERNNRIVRGQDTIPDNWKVMEQDFNGVCVNTYQVTEIPEHQGGEVPDEAGAVPGEKNSRW